jgi:hypothetical protein
LDHEIFSNNKLDVLLSWDCQPSEEIHLSDTCFLCSSEVYSSLDALTFFISAMWWWWWEGKCGSSGGWGKTWWDRCSLKPIIRGWSRFGFS